jgi:hypothetical protein
MQPVLGQIQYDHPYCAGPLAWTDLHAGGVFFCVVYEELIQFRRDGTVRRWRTIMDDSRQLDDEAEQLLRIAPAGHYRVNDRGYLECVFAEAVLIGLPCENDPDLLAFYVSDRRGGLARSQVYRIRHDAGPD